MLRIISLKSMNNFDFLKPVNKDLYTIINDAEELYRDEYFEQCITQTRKFAENVCKSVLGDRRTTEKTFDDMLATLKDKCKGAEQEKEFIDDLYFLKREGNNSVHSSSVKNAGIIALECLQRAFELSINYAVYYQKAKSNLLKLRYDTELLVTGKKSKKSLAEKYEEEKAKQPVKKKNYITQKTTKKTAKTKSIKQTKKSFSFFKFFFIFSLVVSSTIILTIFLLTLI